MKLTPDLIVLLELGPLKLNATIVGTWIVMALLVGTSWLVTRRLRPDVPPGRLRNALEVLVQMIEGQIRAILDEAPPRSPAARGSPPPEGADPARERPGAGSAGRQVLYFAGTLLLFIATANVLAVIPGFRAPTGSLSTTVALTLAVLLAVPMFSIGYGGVGHWLRSFAQPSALLLPLNILGEMSKAVSLSIRLYGNIMSGAVIATILLTVAPFFFPVVMQLFGLLVGLIQAYVFAILAAVYISSAMADPHAKLEDKT